MRVAVLEAPGRVRLEERPVPVPGRGELLVRVEACGICGSDAMDWYVATKAPFVFGHEPAGVVVAVGPEVEGFAPGDRVYVHHHAPCGHCEACRLGRPVHCATWRRPALEPGGMSEFIRVHAHGLADTLKLPPELNALDGTLVEPVACAVRALERGRLRCGEQVLVIGLGFMGQVLGRLARAAGAGRLIGSDPLAERRRWAQTWADQVYTPAELQAASSGDRRYLHPDLVIVTPPLADAIEQGLAAAGSGGRVVLYAPTPLGERVPLPLGELFFREIEIIPSYSAGPDDTRRALMAIQNGVVRAAELVSHTLPLSEVDRAYAMVKDPDVLKVVVTMEGDAA